MKKFLKGRPVEEEKKRDLASLAGKWSQEECDAFDHNTLVFDHIDMASWKHLFLNINLTAFSLQP